MKFRPISLSCAGCLISLYGPKIESLPPIPPVPVEVWKELTAKLSRPAPKYVAGDWRQPSRPWFERFDKRKTKKQFRK